MLSDPLARAESVPIGVNVTVEVHDAVTGALVSSEQIHNLVTLAGRNLVRDALNGTKTTTAMAITAVAVGTEQTAPSSGQTGLSTQVNTGGISQRVVSSGVLTIQRYLGSGDANGNSISEAGIFCDSVMFARVTFAPVAKTTSVTLTITWSVTIGDGS
jgi:hypothetical protein